MSAAAAKAAGTCPHCAAGHWRTVGMHYRITEQGVEHLGPCPDQPPAERIELLAEEKPKPQTLSEVTNRIRAFGPKGNGKAYAAQSHPEGEDDEDGGDA